MLLMQTFMRHEWSDRIKSPPGILLLAWVAAIVFLTLYPWGGWRSHSGDAWRFVSEPWPHYWTVFDVVVNITAYAPLGALLALVIAKPVHKLAGFRMFLVIVLVASSAGSLLSFTLECIQSWLPNRVPSKLDWLSNSIGTLAGASAMAGLIAWLQRGLLANAATSLGRVIAVPIVQDQGQYQNQHQAWSRLTPGRLGIGLLALGLWMVIQINPQRLLFASGDISGLLAEWFDIETSTLSLSQIAWLEPMIVAAQMCIVGSLVWTALSHPLARRLALVLTIGGGLLIKSLAYSQLAPSAEPLWWLTAGAQGGLLIGATALAIMTTLRPATQNRIAFGLLLIVTFSANCAPDNPFFTTMIDNWDTGRLSSLHALIETISVTWPLIALIYLWLAGLTYNRLHD